MGDKVERTLYYYEIKFNRYKQAEDEKRSYIEIIDEIKLMCDKNLQKRFIKKSRMDENKFGVFDYKKTKSKDKVFSFKFIRMRKDIFPQLLQDKDSVLEDLVDADNKSVVESTHVMFDYNDPNTLKICIEFNFHGPRMGDLIIYINRLGLELKFSKAIYPTIISNNKLEEVVDKIGNCKYLTVKVLKENVEAVKKHDKKLGDVLEALGDFSECDNYNLRLRLDYEKNNKENKTLIEKFINLFTKNSKALGYYESFKIEAEDTSTENNNFETFDLLMNKIKSKIKVKCKSNTKTIDSNNIYSLMLSEYKNKIA